MPYHDLSLMRSLVVQQRDKLKTQVKSLLKRRDRPLDLPPTEPDHNAPPPSHWMGFWICNNCNAWAYPEYHRGAHPFGYLRCRNPDCRTVITPNATTSRALHRVIIPKPIRDFVPVERLTGTHREQIPYFAVCPCGLTHRARIFEQSLYKKWKHFQRVRRDEPVLEKLRRFMKHKDDGEVTLIEFEHMQCNKCYRRYDAYRWQHFVIHHDGVFQIDGRDDHGRWAEIRHKE
ncbi:uncharacterized protein N0V89_012492 [Didymosphaeria variabile]|uniref:Probable double zinc ribbon domain-containing protein n=1 Tax=Didymosphaeria variabile TaxID=1932322 RepID=A0A9W8X9I3_9PLEO|nr:uncharacterized protein N0V89_012492 [Didymosphaeria variabile]KAJ4344748.1 hypothetical protein N0V89_012492 [Didymosphaeria variabile]